MSDSYLILTPYGGSGFGPPFATESDVALSRDITGAAVASRTALELLDYSLDIEQTLNIGAQGSGAGAGKVVFNPLSITKRVDVLSPLLLQSCCAGTAFAKLDLLLTKPGGPGPGGLQVFLQYTFKLAAVATIGSSSDDEGPRETVTFGYGGLQVRYAPQNPDGSLGAVVVKGWNRVRNVADIGTSPL